ncbi:unnamed protein product, partial [marine sediment metagenome]
IYQAAEVKDMRLRQGYSDEVWKMLLEANKPILGPAELIRLKHRHDLAHLSGLDPSLLHRTETEGWLMHGYDAHQAAEIDLTAWTLPPITYLLELARRFPEWAEKFQPYAKGLGFPPEISEALQKLTVVMPTPTDLVRFGVREVFSPEIAKKFRQYEDFPKDIMKWADQIGMTQELMEMYWASHWDLPSPGQGFDMYHRRIISYEELGVLLRAKDVMPFWRDKLIQISHRL